MSSNIAKSLLEERANILEQARALNETAEKEGRDLTADAQQTWDGHMEAIRALDLRLAEVNDLDQRNAKAEEMRARYEAATPATPTEPEKQLTDDEKFRTWGRRPGEVFEMRGITRETRDNTLSSGAGTIPQGFRSQLWEYAVESAGILQAGIDLLETDSGNTIVLPRVTAYSTVGAATEATAISESDPTFSSVNSTVSKRGYVWLL